MVTIVAKFFVFKIIKIFMKKEKISRDKKKYLIIPLTFSKGLKLSIVEIQRHLVQKRWQYTALSLISVVLMTSGIFFFENYTAKGATYGWLQTDWSGGVSGTTADHDNDRSGWDSYSSIDANIDASTAGELTLTSGVKETEDTSTADFETWDLPPTLTAVNGVIKLFECGDNVYSDMGLAHTTIEIAGNCWLNENLKDKTVDIAVCYDDIDENCNSYGALYNHTSIYNGADPCMSGWHLSTDAEWFALEDLYATGACSATRSGTSCAPAGTELAIGGSSGFDVGFYGTYTGSAYGSFGTTGRFWVDRESSDYPMYRDLFSTSIYISRAAPFLLSEAHYSIRCVKD